MGRRTFHFRTGVAICFALCAVLCMMATKSFGEKKEWQAGTIVDVKAHGSGTQENQRLKKYDVSIKVGKKIYVVLYAPEKQLPEPDLYVGMARTVLIDGEVLKFNDIQGRTHPMRILSSKDSPTESK